MRILHLLKNEILRQRPKLSQKKIVKDSILLSGAGYLSHFLSFARGVIIARLLGPTLFGYLSGARLVLQLSPQMHMGALHGMSRYLSIYKGAGDRKQYEAIADNGISLITLFSASIVFCVILYTYFIEGQYSLYTIWGIRLFAVVAFLQQMINITHAFLRANYQFKTISISQVIFGWSNLILAIAFVLWFGLYGAIASFLIANLISLAYLLRKTEFAFKLDLDRETIKKLLFIGAPISLFFFNEAILNSLDKFMIIKFLSVEQLGVYSIAFPFFSVVEIIPASISYIMYPKMLQAYGSSSGDITSTKRYFEIPTKVIAVFVAYVIGILFISIKYIFFYLLPRYGEAAIIAKILCFSIFFSSISMLAVRVLITRRNYRVLMAFQGIAIFANAVLNYMFIRMGYGISGVALATGASFIIYSVFILQHTLGQYYHTRLGTCAKQLKLFWPILYVGLILFLLSTVNLFHLDVIRSFKLDMIQLTTNIAFFSLLTVPLFYVSIMREIKLLLV